MSVRPITATTTTVELATVLDDLGLRLRLESHPEGWYARVKRPGYVAAHAVAPTPHDAIEAALTEWEAGRVER